MKLMHALKLAPNGRVLGYQTVYINAGDVLADVAEMPADFSNYVYTDGQLVSSPAPSSQHRLAPNGEWIMDWRNTPLYRCDTGAVYSLGDVAAGAAFDGLGDLPAWLTVQPQPSSAYDWDAVAQGWVLNDARADLLAKAEATAAFDSRIQSVEQQVLLVMDSTAQVHGFANIADAVLRASSAVGQRAAVGVAFLDWRDDVRLAVNAALSAYSVDNVKTLTDSKVNKLIAALPALVLPEEAS